MNEKIKIAPIVLTLRVENTHQKIRSTKRAIETIEQYILKPCKPTRLDSGEFELKIPYYTDEGLGRIMDDLLREIAVAAALGQCFSKSGARLEGTDRCW